MSNEELEKKIEFIVEQQAQLVVNQEKAEERMTRLENIVLKLYEDTNAKFNALVDSQIRLVDSHTHLAAALTQTNERLDAFIVVVERYVTEGRSGKSQNPDEDES